jgi:hypothetical protein
MKDTLLVKFMGLKSLNHLAVAADNKKSPLLSHLWHLRTGLIVIQFDNGAIAFATSATIRPIGL